MQEKPSLLERLNQKMRESLTIKLLTIGVLILLLLIPLEMVQNLIRERNYRNQNTVSEVSSEWSRGQQISGPILTIPYHSYEKTTVNNVEKLVVVTRFVQVMPENLSINGELLPKTLHRGIYDVVVYEGKLQAKGSFTLEDFHALHIAPEDVLWGDAVVNLGISDLRGITNQIQLKMAGTEQTFQPGLKNVSMKEAGVHAAIALLGDDTELNFSFNLDLKGSSFMNFVPLAKTTDVHLTSSWASPSFQGSFLPADRNLENGFNAHWKVLNLNRPIPPVVQSGSVNYNEHSFGVELYMPTTQYQKSERTAKYGALVIALVFLIIFFVQIMRRLSIHPFQYILIGLALVIFYTLLVSISEFTSFNTSYLISGGAVIVLVSVYLHGVIKNIKSSAIIFALQSFIYGFIYVIIQLEDTALLIGSIGLFLTLAIIMLASRKVDWYHLNTSSPKKELEG